MKTIYKIVLLVVLAFGCSIWIYYHIEQVKPVVEVTHMIDKQYALEQDFLSDTDYSSTEPKIILNPYGNSPLTALVIFETKDLTAPSVIIKGKDELSTYTHTFTPAKKHILPIYGLYADTVNEVILKVNHDETVLSIQTEALPDDLVLPTSVVFERHMLSNDLYFVTPSSMGYTAAYDVNGDVRWYFSENYLWDIERLDNGHLLLSTERLVNPPYYTTGLYEMDLLGKIYFEYSLPGGYHHDYFEMENGNLLVASDDFSSGTVEDYIVEVDRSTGNVVRKFDLKDILPKDQGKSASWTEYDWFHNNSVWYDQKTNSITLSGRHQDAVINIDYDSGELNWIIGDSTAWEDDMKKYFFTPVGELEWQWSQHAAMILPNGDVFLFDNGNNRSKIADDYIGADENYSRGVIYRIDTASMTIRQIWQYGKERGRDFYSPYISDVDYLGDSHYLIHSGGHSVVEGHVSNEPAGLTKVDSLNSITTEILHDQVIFEMQLPTNTYRAEKMSLYANDIYRSGKGKYYGNMGETKSLSKTPSILFAKEDRSIYDTYGLKIVKEKDRLAITGTFKKEDQVEIILDSLFDKKAYQMVISKKPYTAMCVDVFNQDEEKNGITVTKYINDLGISGKYYLYIKINGMVYDLDQYIIYS